MRNAISHWTYALCLAALATGGLLLYRPSPVLAHERYNDGCQNCHGAFTGPTSPRGTVFPANSKHEMHRGSSYMATSCDLCHTTGDNRNPFLASSNGTAINVGIGCTGCHGQSFGGTVGNRSAGLRQHHARNGVTYCANCHSDDPAPLPESSRPLYYGTADTRADDPCNLAPDHRENWSIGDTLGLDNDGDNVYDDADSDCSPPCPGDLNGDGVVSLADLTTLLSNYGTLSGATPDQGDLDGDGDVDLSDLAGLLSTFGVVCP